MKRNYNINNKFSTINYLLKELPKQYVLVTPCLTRYASLRPTTITCRHRQSKGYIATLDIMCLRKLVNSYVLIISLNILCCAIGII